MQFSQSRSGSFAKTIHYVEHDKDGAGTTRIGFRHTENLATTNVAKEMTDTWKSAQAIRQRTGGENTTKPVYHYSLSWRPDDRPDSKTMLESARASLKALGLENHQTLIVEHTDQPHKHVHIVVNLVHPRTGLVADLSNDQYKLAEFCHAYEKVYGIRSPLRAARIEMEKPDLSKEAKAKYDAIRATQEKKRRTLQTQHRQNSVARRTERANLHAQYRKDREDIIDNSRKELDRTSRGRAPRFEIKPPPKGAPKEWQTLAKAMKPYFETPWKVKPEFKQALSRIAQRPGSLFNRQFTIKVEGRDFNVPVKMHRWAHGNIVAYKNRATIGQRDLQLQARSELYTNDIAHMDHRHGAAVEAEKREVTALRREQVAERRAWREEYGVKNEAREAFENAAEKPAESERAPAPESTPAPEPKPHARAAQDPKFDLQKHVDDHIAGLRRDDPQFLQDYINNHIEIEKELQRRHAAQIKAVVQPAPAPAKELKPAAKLAASYQEQFKAFLAEMGIQTDPIMNGEKQRPHSGASYAGFIKDGYAQGWARNNDIGKYDKWDSRTAEKAQAKVADASLIAKSLSYDRPANANNAFLTRHRIPHQTIMEPKFYGTKLPEGTIIVPLKDNKDQLQAAQYIDPWGITKEVGNTKGAFHPLGDIRARTVFIATDLASAAAFHRVTGRTAVAALSSENLPDVAKAIREVNPHGKIIVASENNARKTEQTGVNKDVQFAQEAADAVDGTVAIPEFYDKPGHTWANWAQQFGDEKLSDYASAITYGAEEESGLQAGHSDGEDHEEGL